MTDSIPRELAEALLGAHGPAATIGVSTAASTFPSEVFPGDFEILGHVEHGALAVTILVARSIKPSGLRAHLETLLAQAGFDVPPPERRSGFQSAEVTYYRRYTRGNKSLTFQIRPSPEGGSIVAVSVHPRNERAEERHRQFELRNRFEDDSPMPNLPGPPGTESHGGGGGSSGAFRHIHGVLHPPIPVKSAASHYDAVLRSQGWETVGQMIDDVSAYMAYRLVDDKGTRWAAMFTIIAKGTDTLMGLQFALNNIEERE